MTPKEKYIEFLKSKIEIAPETGLAIEMPMIKFEDGTFLKPHQRDGIQWAIRGGRRALFESFGLGKTIQQLLICWAILKVEDGKALIVCPLGVRQEFKKDAERKLGVTLTYVKTQQECDAMPEGSILITNYERVRDGNIDPKTFTVTSLDEASVLRSFGSKTYQTFLDKFKGIKYKFVCTATPSPNKFKELIHYAGYLEVMDTGQALTRFFQRDSTKANNLTLYPHKEKEFWLWMSTWALFVTKPSDLGYSDEGYDLPGFEVIYHVVNVDHGKAGQTDDGQTKMFRDAALGLKDAAREKRDSIENRVCKMLEIITNLKSISKEFTDENTARSEQGILRSKQGFRKKEVPGLLSSEQGENRQGEKEGLHDRVYENSCQEEIISRRKSLEEPKEAGEICERQRIPGQSKPSGQNDEEKKSKYKIELQAETGVWNNTGGLQSNAEGSEREVCNLPNERSSEGSKESICRPLPFKWECPRASMLQLQLWFGTLQRQCESFKESGRVLEQTIIWCDRNREQELIEKILKACGISVSSIYGSLSDEEKETRLNDWKEKRTSVFLSKPEMYGAGVNLQQASKMIFVGIDYEFNSFIQAIHRIYRFLQTNDVEIHIIYAESEGEILKALENKWKQHNYLIQQMTEIMKENGLSSTNVEEKLLRTLGLERRVEKGKFYEAINNDCTVETMCMEDESVDLIHTSIPFSNHYEYTPSFNDFGHNAGNGKFFEQMDFLTPELLRVLRPGRLAVIHVKDRILFGNATGTGMPTVDPFSDMTVFHFLKHGFQYMGRITIETDVVRENNQTYRLGWTEKTKDGTKMGVGCPEYLLLFRKLPSDTSKAYADVPVVKTKQGYNRGQWQIDARAKWNSSGERFLSPDELRQHPIERINKYFGEWAKTSTYNYEDHTGIAIEMDRLGKLPATFETLRIPARTPWVWDDVNRMITLNSKQTQKKLQNHVCPLQFDIVDRVIENWSNAGELVYDPFGGIMTVPYRAIKLGRKGKACELNADYFRDGLSYLRAIEQEVQTPTLFQIEEIEVETAV